MLVDGAGAVNHLVFNGTAGLDSFNLSRDPALLSLERVGAQVVTTTNTFFAWTVRGGRIDDNFNINEPLAINGIELNLEGGTGNNTLSYTTGFNQFYRPAGLNGATLGGALVSLKDIGSAAVTLAAPATSIEIRGDDANNQFSLLGEGPSAVVVTLDNSTQLAVGGTLTTVKPGWSSW